MKRFMLNIIIALGLVLAPATVSLGGTAYAACGTPSSSKTRVLSGIGESGSNCSESGVTNAISTVVQILSIVVGIAAVIVVIVAGFKYITSGCEAGRVANAKNTL